MIDADFYAVASSDTVASQDVHAKLGLDFLHVPGSRELESAHLATLLYLPR